MATAMSYASQNFSSNSNSASLPSNDQEPSPETLLCNLLQTVPVEDDEEEVCTSCEDGIPASAKCRDCTELLCDECVRAHQRVRITKDHRIIRYNGGGSSTKKSSTGSISPLMATSMSVSPSSSTTDKSTCMLHNEPFRSFCENCFVACCCDCAFMEHFDHKVVAISDGVESARVYSLRLEAETRKAVANIRESIENIERFAENVDVRSQHCTYEIRNYMRKAIQVIEDRERELIFKVEQQRMIRAKALMAQTDNLRIALNQLMRSNDMLNECLENGTKMDLFYVNAKANFDLRILRNLRLTPCDEEAPYFIAPEISLSRAITTLGDIGFKPAHVKPKVEVYPPIYMPRQELKPVHVQRESPNRIHTRGRPIHGVQLPIVVHDNGSVPSMIIGSEGDGDGQLCRPWGVCCDKKGNFIVADRSNNRVQIFSAGGAYVHKFGSHGNGPGQFDRPAGITADHMNRIIVADKDNHRIQIFTMEGHFVLMFGEKGCRNGQFNYPWDVAVNNVGNIVVSDTRNHRIQMFSGEGVFLKKYGFDQSAPAWKHFDSPRGVCFNPHGNVIVTDFNNHRLVVIDSEFEHAQFLGQEGCALKQFLRPQGVVCDDDGRIIVADSRNNRLQVIGADGTFMWQLGETGKEPGQMDRPSGICLTTEGRIAVVDFGNNRVQIF